MEKIKLTNRGREIYHSIFNGTFSTQCNQADEGELLILEKEGFITTHYGPSGIDGINLTKFGVAYYKFNPKLKNPTFLEDTKFVITTTLSLIILIVTIVGRKCS